MPVATFRNPSEVEKPATFGWQERSDPVQSVPSSEGQQDLQRSMPNKRALLFNGLFGSPRVIVTQVCPGWPARDSQIMPNRGDPTSHTHETANLRASHHGRLETAYNR